MSLKAKVQSPTSRQRGPLPFVYVNVAMTADGKLATANRAVSRFSSRRDHEHLMELRTRADAVMSGARTVDLNPVTLGPGSAKYRRMRLRHGLAEYNLRVTVSGSGSVDPGAELFKRHFSPVIVLTTRRASARRLERLRQVADEVKVCGEREVDFARALRWLREKWNVRRLLCEGGGEINDGLFRAGLVNELHLTICPKVFGGRQAPTLSDGRGAANLAGAMQMKLHSARRYGDEMFLVYRREQKGKGRKMGAER